MNDRRKILITKISNLGYILGCIILYCIALSIIGLAVISIFQDMKSGSFSVYKLLDEVALLVFAIAVIDVAKYLMVEEVLRGKEDRGLQEDRKAFTKFGIIIATALALEGLVLTIELSKTNPPQMIYPMGLLVISVLFMVGMGMYQWFTSLSEKDK